MWGLLLPFGPRVTRDRLGYREIRDDLSTILNVRSTELEVAMVAVPDQSGRG